MDLIWRERDPDTWREGDADTRREGDPARMRRRHPANVEHPCTSHSPALVGVRGARTLRGQTPRSVLPTWLKVTARVLSGDGLSREALSC